MSAPSPKVQTPKVEPVNPFDLLSGLISKTESKQTPDTKEEIKKDDPLLMLAGLMKSVKPPTHVDTAAAAPSSPVISEPTPVVKTEPGVNSAPPPLVSEASSVTTKDRVTKVEVKQEPKEAVKKVATVGGRSLFTCNN